MDRHERGADPGSQPNPTGIAGTIVEEGGLWRQPFGGHAPKPQAPRMLAARWRSLDPGRREVATVTDPSCHVIGLVLHRMDVSFKVDGRTLVDGIILPGMMNVTEPGAPAKGVFRGPYDALHLSVPNDIVAECAADGQSRDLSTIPTRFTTEADPVAQRLGCALLTAAELGTGFGTLYADAIGLAIVARLMAAAAGTGTSRRLRLAPLPAWRLKRAIEYIEVNLAGPVTLAELAASVGVSRMHFAAQFKAATGVPPHEYLLRRRIERAQELLTRSREPLADVAVQVGFSSQSHFTTVFKRFAGQPPRAWRNLYHHVA
jgi:AraC family transcriptional regulator